MPWIATYPIASVTDLPPAPAFARLFPGFGGGAWRRAEGGLGASCLVVPSPLPRSMWETPARALVMRGKMSDLWQEHKAHVSITLSADGWEPKQKMMAGVWLGAIAEEWNLGAYRLEIRRDARLVVPFLT